jgi:hypothetical protein
MGVGLVDCPYCGRDLPTSFFNLSAFTPCPQCHHGVQVHGFPAFLKEQTSSGAGESITLEDEASCYYHPDKKAVIPCSVCGRFLCSLCDVEFNDRHICAPCLEAGKEKKKMKNLETRRVLYDDIALALAIIPIIMVWITIVTAPAAIYVAIRHWRSPSSIIPRTKARFIIAIALACLQLGGWAIFFTTI